MLNTIFLIAAVIGGTIMVCQFIMTLAGMGDHGDLHGGFGDGAHAGGDLDGGGQLGDVGDAPSDHHTPLHTAADGGLSHPDGSWLFSVISFRTLIAAAAFFGAAGRAALAADLSQPASLAIALAAGFCAMYGMYWLMQAIAGFQSSGNEYIGNALGKQATVYIPIPANRAGYGKVQLSMQNRIVELQAMTDEDSRLRTGESVEVVAIAAHDLVSVRRTPAPVSTAAT